MPESNAVIKLKSLLASKKDDLIKFVAILEMAPSLRGNLDAVVSVLDDHLGSAEPIVQVAIMDLYFELSGDPFHKDDLIAMMDFAASLKDAGQELYTAARIALGRINGLSMDRLDDWGDGRLEITASARRRRRRKRRGRAAAIVEEITVMIHGTWASDGTWWRPNGDFFEYVKNDLGRSDLYGKADLFVWSGKNRNRKRKQAAVELDKWLKDHRAAEVNVFAHSHGANVAMLATQKDTQFSRLVMLSPPVRKIYFADWANVAHAYNIQANFDPVVAIARGGSKFNLPQVREKLLKVNGHSASHDPQVWKDEKLAKFIDMPW